MNDHTATEQPTAAPAVGAQVDRRVRPHAIRLASQLQSAAYSHGYEDGHPSNAITRQDKYSAASQRLRGELCEAIELLISERDGLMQTLRDEMDENLRLRELGGARPDENITAMTERIVAENAQLRAQLATFTPLRAKGVVDADDNLDCWDTNPYEICTRHVAALNEKDPAAMWRVVQLFARDEAVPGA